MVVVFPARYSQSSLLSCVDLIIFLLTWSKAITITTLRSCTVTAVGDGAERTVSTMPIVPYSTVLYRTDIGSGIVHVLLIVDVECTVGSCGCKLL